MKTFRNRPAWLALGVTLLAWAAPTLAQDVSPREPADLIGIWEGFDSEGAHLHWEISRVTAASGDAVLILGATRTGGTLSDLRVRYDFRRHDTDSAFLVPGSQGEPIVVTWYSDSGIRLSWPEGRQAVLALVRGYEPSAEGEARQLSGSMMTSAAFTDVVQATLLELEGTWSVAGSGAESAGTVEVRVVDPAAGHVRWSGPVDGLGRSGDVTLDLHLRRAGESALTFVTNEVEYVFLREDRTLSVRVDGTDGVRLQQSQ